ncbi:hypothetical protein Pelo_19596 [Pelomyxa schiedti]|nr:hypothetical protein Pelo_19596 [Pelomyxa schiedti]
MKTYTDTAKTELISVEVLYTQYCTEVAPMSSYFVYEYTCQTSIDTLTIDIDMAITVTQFSDSTCTTPKKHWNYYSPECHDSDITTDSYHVTCSADDSYADVQTRWTGAEVRAHTSRRRSTPRGGAGTLTVASGIMTAALT